MKVVNVLYSGLGGHGNVFFSFVQGDDQRKMEHSALFAGVEYIRAEYETNCKAMGIPYQFVQKNGRFDGAFSQSMIAHLRKSTAHIIYLQGSRFIVQATIAALLSKQKKHIVVAETQANHLKTKADWLFLFIALFFAHHLVFLTEAFKEEIRNKFRWIHKASKTSVITSGLDLGMYKPAVKPASSLITLGMQSRIVPIKDHETLLKAFALLKNEHPSLEVKLKIAGDGESLLAMQQLAKSLKIDQSVIFTGMLNEVDLVSFMHSLDIYIHASLGETLSTSLMQAMACRLPIIASDVPGINNMIEHDITGILVPVKNERCLADALSELIAHPSKAIALKDAAFKFAHLHYGSKTMSTQYFSLFEKIGLGY